MTDCTPLGFPSVREWGGVPNCKQCDALRAEVARLQGVADSANMDSAEWRDKMDKMTAEVVALKAKMARYEADLTDEQISLLWLNTPDTVGHHQIEMLDSAIRKVRGEP